MGNRAILKPVGSNVGVYLHWNGGRDSVEAFLKYCEMRGFRAFGGASADGYGKARFMQVVGNFFGGDLSVGVAEDVTMGPESNPGDNGIYEIDGWNIVGRFPKDVWEQREYSMQDMLESIDEAQPRNDRFGKRYLRAKVVPTKQLRIGDTVYIYDDLAYNKPKSQHYQIIGIGQNQHVNGRNVRGIPYINKYKDGDPDNINNYLLENEYRATVKKGRK